MGGILLALIEGAGLMLNRVLANPQNLPPLPADDPSLAAAMAGGAGGFPGMPQAQVVAPPEAASSSGGWFGVLFGKEEEKKPAAGRGKSEILESFDTPSAPIPSFEYK
uniref:Uncharacterized protein n=1 Tax=Arundo donax TaxID=35708 RepID=A0A0A9UDH0_ARUDO